MAKQQIGEELACDLPVYTGGNGYAFSVCFLFPGFRSAATIYLPVPQILHPHPAIFFLLASSPLARIPAYRTETPLCVSLFVSEYSISSGLFLFIVRRASLDHMEYVLCSVDRFDATRKR